MDEDRGQVPPTEAGDTGMSETTGPQGPPQEPAEPVSQEAATPSQDARNMAMLCHLLAIFTGFLGPLIVWLVKKDADPFVDRQGKEALNFQITVMIAVFVSGLLAMACIGVILVPVVIIADLVFCIMACVAANKGRDYRYPVSIRFIK